MKASLFLAVAVLSSVFSTNMGVPVVNRRQIDPEDQPLCPERRAVALDEFANPESGVCKAKCRLPRLSYAGIPFGPIEIVDTYQCCENYTQEKSGSQFVCVAPGATLPPTTPPPTTRPPTTPPVIIPPVVECPSTGIRSETQYASLSNVCPQQCTFAIPSFGIVFQLITYECCDGYRSEIQANGLVCTIATTTSPPATEAVVSTEAVVATEAAVSTEATTSTGTTEPEIPRCTSSDRSLSTYVNVEPNSLCPVECFTQSSFAGASFGPKNEQTRYQCCPGFTAQRVYPNHPSNFDYECVRV